MLRCCLVSLVILAMPVASTAAVQELVLKYGNGKADGRRSIAGTGQMIRFELPDASQRLRGVRIHGARYGTPQPPNEDVSISVVSGDEVNLVHTELVPYSKFQRGDNRWITINFAEPIEVPKTFWIIFEFNAQQTKGVYVSFDASTGGQHSKTGLPGGSSNPVNFAGDWMIQALLTKPQ